MRQQTPFVAVVERPEPSHEGWRIVLREEPTPTAR
jgi:hypothetical protein